MTPDTALYQYFNGFMQAFPVTAVPEDAVLPWLTYEYAESDLRGPAVSVTANIWHRSESEAVPNATARAFRRYIEADGRVACDGGFLHIRPGKPFSLAVPDEDNSIKRRYINLEVDFEIE